MSNVAASMGGSHQVESMILGALAEAPDSSSRLVLSLRFLEATIDEAVLADYVRLVRRFVTGNADSTAVAKAVRPLRIRLMLDADTRDLATELAYLVNFDGLDPDELREQDLLIAAGMARGVGQRRLFLSRSGLLALLRLFSVAIRETLPRAHSRYDRPEPVRPHDLTLRFIRDTLSPHAPDSSAIPMAYPAMNGSRLAVETV